MHPQYSPRPDQFDLMLLRSGYPVSDNPKFVQMRRTKMYLTQRKNCGALAIVFRKTADWFERRSGQAHPGKLLEA